MGGAFATFGEQVFREGDLFGGIKRVVGEGPGDGFVEDFDVGEKRGDGGVARESVDFRAEGGGAGDELSAVGGGERDAGGGDFFRDGCGGGRGGWRLGVGSERESEKESERESESESESAGGSKEAHGGRSFLPQRARMKRKAAKLNR